jgi:DNA-binding transcriptional MerR regulator
MQFSADLIGTSETARELGISESAVRVWVATGKLVPAVRAASGRKLFVRDQVKALKRLREERADGNAR